MQTNKLITYSSQIERNFEICCPVYSKKFRQNRMAIIIRKYKHKGKKMTEGKSYLIMLDFISSGKMLQMNSCIYRTSLDTPCLCVCGKYSLEYAGAPCKVCRTSRRCEVWWWTDLYQLISSYQACNATHIVTCLYSARCQFLSICPLYSLIQ